MNKYIFIIFLLLSSGCSSSKVLDIDDNQDGLSKLSFKESMRRSLQAIAPSADVIFVNTNWDTLSNKELDSIFSREDYTLDEYVNEEEVVKAFVVRKSTRRDLRRTKRRIKALGKQRAGAALIGESSDALETEFPSIAIDCNEIDSLLRVIYIKDQEHRKDAADSDNIDLSVDQLNQYYVINVIEQCNFPEDLNISKQGALTIWLVIQHGSKGQREKYFERFQRAKELGLISGGILATMEDRMLMDNHLPQKYGTQLRTPYPGKYEAYQLLSKDSVDFYRKSVGLEPLAKYLEKINNRSKRLDRK